jgi:hypothetical protein
MDVLNQKQLLESANCVVDFFSIFFEISFSNFSKKYFSKNGQRLVPCDLLFKKRHTALIYTTFQLSISRRIQQEAMT